MTHIKYHLFRKYFLCLFVLFTLSCGNKQKYPALENPLTCSGQPIVLGDPFMYTHEGKYYLTGTYGDANKGFPCYVSENMVDWELKGMLWEKTEDTWLDNAFWAPEIEYYQGKFYLTYSGYKDEIGGLRIALAVSDRPEGPFKDLYSPWFDQGYGAIDGHIFTDDDGTPYLFFSVNGFEDGYSFGRTYGFELAKDLSAPVSDTIRLIEASQPWERVNWENNRCNEGPFVFKYKETYYMTYSANHTFEPNYGIGYATASSPLGPWTKAEENPIASKIPEKNITGIGHNSIVMTKNPREMLLVYHSHADPQQPENQKRYANIGRLIINDKDKLVFYPSLSE